MFPAPERPEADRRFRLIVGAAIALFAAGAMASARQQAAALRAWTYDYFAQHEPNLNPRATLPDLGWAPWPRWVYEARKPAEHAIEVVEAGLLTAGLGLSILMIRRDRPTPTRPSRPGRRRLGPGRVAALIATGWLAFGTVVALRAMLIDPHVPEPPNPFVPPASVAPHPCWPSILGAIPLGLGEAIAAAWIFLALTGRWRREPADPLERLGRWLGWAWIAVRFALQFADVLGMVADPT